MTGHAQKPPLRNPGPPSWCRCPNCSYTRKHGYMPCLGPGPWSLTTPGDHRPRPQPGDHLKPLVWLGLLAFFALLAIAWIEHGGRGLGAVAFLALIHGAGRDARREMLLMREGRLRDPFDATRDDGRR